MKRLVLFLLTIFIISGLFGQTKPFTLNYSFYRLENIDSLNKHSLDSLTGELQYYGINNESVSGLIFPIVIYKSYDDWTKENLFRFVLVDTFFIDHLETKGKINTSNGRLYSDLRFFKRDRANFAHIMPIDSSLRVNIDIKADSIWINDKIFKIDKTGRIFQRFTGY